MKTFAQTSGTNDIIFDSSGNLLLSEGKQSYTDIIGDRLRTLRGECQLNENRGLPYLETVFLSSSRLDIWKHYAKQEVEALSFVRAIISFNASYSPTRKELKFDLIVETDQGAVTVSS